MRQNNISLLSTRPLQQELIAKAAEKNISIEMVPFIETRPIVSESLRQRILHLSHHILTVVFTSVNAVDAVAKALNGAQPSWKVFCIGSATRQAIEKFFSNITIVGEADAATALADEIIAQKNIHSVIFFGGDRRREELPEKLSKHHIDLHEIPVYTTMETPRQLDKDFDGILFCSPSAVNSFFSLNKINPETILFAIGQSTANEIKRHTDNKITISRKPGKELLAGLAIDYFETRNRER